VRGIYYNFEKFGGKTREERIGELTTLKFRDGKFLYQMKLFFNLTEEKRKFGCSKIKFYLLKLF